MGKLDMFTNIGSVELIGMIVSQTDLPRKISWYSTYILVNSYSNFIYISSPLVSIMCL